MRFQNLLWITPILAKDPLPRAKFNLNGVDLIEVEIDNSFYQGKDQQKLTDWKVWCVENEFMLEGPITEEEILNDDGEVTAYKVSFNPYECNDHAPNGDDPSSANILVKLVAHVQLFGFAILDQHVWILNKKFDQKLEIVFKDEMGHNLYNFHSRFVDEDGNELSGVHRNNYDPPQTVRALLKYGPDPDIGMMRRSFLEQCNDFAPTKCSIKQKNRQGGILSEVEVFNYQNMVVEENKCGYEELDFELFRRNDCDWQMNMKSFVLDPTMKTDMILECQVKWCAYAYEDYVLELSDYTSETDLMEMVGNETNDNMCDLIQNTCNGVDFENPVWTSTEE